MRIYAPLCALMRLYAPLCVFAPLKFSKFVVLGYNYAHINTNIYLMGLFSNAPYGQNGCPSDHIIEKVFYLIFKFTIGLTYNNASFNNLNPRLRRRDFFY